MKKQISTIGLMSVLGVALSGCGEQHENVASFTDVSDCMKILRGSQEYCEKIVRESKAIHRQVAPKFKSSTDCEEEFGRGNCESTSFAARENNTSVLFMPFISGYSAPYPTYDSDGKRIQSTVRSQPLYKGKNGLTTAQGVKMNRGIAKLAPSRVKAVQFRSVVSRGGFTSAVRSGGFGG